MTDKLNSFAFATSAAIVAALSMIILGILGNIGLYDGAVKMMMQWHMLFSLTPIGIFTGTIEAVVITFAFFYIFVWIYNKITNLSESIEGDD